MTVRTACHQGTVPVRPCWPPFLVAPQAKGVLHAELGVSPDEAFRLLSSYSQNNNQRVRKISAGLVEGRIAAAELRPGPR
jgi:hypothetical protein